MSQFRVEIVKVAGCGGNCGVRLRNVRGEYLTDILGWNKTSSSQQIFSVEKYGEFQAFRSHKGEYLSIKRDGSLELITVPTASTPNTTQQAPVPGPVPVVCEAGWAEFDGKCYKFFSEAKVMFEAQNECLQEQVRRPLRGKFK